MEITSLFLVNESMCMPDGRPYCSVRSATESDGRVVRNVYDMLWNTGKYKSVGSISKAWKRFENSVPSSVEKSAYIKLTPQGQGQHPMPYMDMNGFQCLFSLPNHFGKLLVLETPSKNNEHKDIKKKARAPRQRRGEGGQRRGEGGPPEAAQKKTKKVAWTDVLSVQKLFLSAYVNSDFGIDHLTRKHLYATYVDFCQKEHVWENMDPKDHRKKEFFNQLYNYFKISSSLKRRPATRAVIDKAKVKALLIQMDAYDVDRIMPSMKRLL